MLEQAHAGGGARDRERKTPRARFPLRRVARLGDVSLDCVERQLE
jgi:hypothetical protein